MRSWTVSRVNSEGFAAAPVFVLKKTELLPDHRKITPECSELEIARYEHAVAKVQKELMELSARDEIFFAHSVLAGDQALHDGVAEKIQKAAMNAEAALLEVCEAYVQMFEAMEKEYMRERAVDLKDVMNRILLALQNREEAPVEPPRERYILAARDLTPSDMMRVDLEQVAGIVTEEGGITSHVSILARNYGIPCLVGIGGILPYIQQGMTGIIDTLKGCFMLEPDAELQTEYEQKIAAWQRESEAIPTAAQLPSGTMDGREIQICANTGNLFDIKKAVQCGADGVGLLRTEQFYMELDRFPTEEEQYRLYRQAAELMNGRQLTIRTLDIGGDKALPYLELPMEQNPYLGCRAIRWSLTQREIFKTQLRALLRASIGGSIRIMYPMLISLEELQEANALLQECRQELRTEGIPFAEVMEIGMMIETPAAVWLADDFAQQVDFFSIGTNDLTQYILAVDRGNPHVSAYYNTFHPAVLRALSYVIETAHRHAKKVSVCGEFAGEELALPLLAAMGVDELSVAPARVAAAKKKLSSISCAEMQKLLQEVLRQSTVEAVMKVIQRV